MKNKKARVKEPLEGAGDESHGILLVWHTCGPGFNPQWCETEKKEEKSKHCTVDY